jgi:hypothetical protein
MNEGHAGSQLGGTVPPVVIHTSKLWPRRLVWIWVGALFLLHHDFWWWDDPTLVFGFIPIGLAYHSAYSVVAGITWWLAIRHAWPEEIEEWASAGESETAIKGRVK